MNITIDKENKTIVIYGEVGWIYLVDFMRREIGDDRLKDPWDDYKIIPYPKEIQYIPIYPAAPMMPQIVPYPVPYHCTPYPYWFPYTVTCKV